MGLINNTGKSLFKVNVIVHERREFYMLSSSECEARSKAKENIKLYLPGSTLCSDGIIDAYIIGIEEINET